MAHDALCFQMKDWESLQENRCGTINDLFTPYDNQQSIFILGFLIPKYDPLYHLEITDT